MLLDSLVCSIAGYFYKAYSTDSDKTKGWVKMHTTSTLNAATTTIVCGFKQTTTFADVKVLKII